MKSLFEAVTIKAQEVSRATAAFCVQFPICETVRWAQLLSKLGLHLVVAVFLVLCRKVTLTFKLQDILQATFKFATANIRE